MKNIALHILDLVENSARANAGKVQISITEDPATDSYILKIEDDGKGMEAEILQKATNPFYTSRTTRKIGMGLPLIQMNAERTGGSFNLQSEPGKGTCMEAHFRTQPSRQAAPGRNRRGAGFAGSRTPAAEAGLCAQNHFRLILFRYGGDTRNYR